MGIQVSHPLKLKFSVMLAQLRHYCLDRIFPLSDSASTGANILIQGVECGLISVPLHKINLKSDLVSVSVIVGVRRTLPVKRISLLLSNGLACGKVTANAIVTNETCNFDNTEQFEKEFPDLFPACAVTGAMSKST
ncbi:hypothetical protein HOLleu_22172 [Holothuria leucospilota]|uniref:Uncharacterized protein n=1 Tax=Holothuria leucospilota TaxID=206669 RepID=A0A9Q1BZ19_HOLLE|nr:hypothetical protein HOLleu_22172 [Holothuria leucospilota]